MMDARFSLALRLGDNTLILAHQNSKWCGMGPTLEEDIAMTNIALDLIGHARLWLNFAGELEGKGKSEDELAFLRDAHEFRNSYLCEQKNNDYGQTLMRQYLFDHWHVVRIAGLAHSSDRSVYKIANKIHNEVRYHLRRSSDLVVRLAQGTKESNQRMQTSLDYLWPSFLSLFEDIDDDDELEQARIAPRPSCLLDEVINNVSQQILTALEIPTHDYFHKGAAVGIHSENLGHILSDMQFLQRNYPGLEW